MRRFWIIALVVTQILLMMTVRFNVTADAQSLKVAPLNPDFEDFAAAFSHVDRESMVAAGFQFGYMPPPVNLKALNPAPLFSLLKQSAAVLPAMWDWRERSGVTPVKNQGSCGSCWAFGNLGSLESKHKISRLSHPDVNLSEENVNSCHMPWLVDRCDGGNTFVALSHLTGLVKRNTDQQFQKGILSETQDPYQGANPHNSDLCDDSARPFPKYRITGARWLSNDTSVMKDAIYNKGPIVTAYYAESPYGPHWYNDNTIYHYPGYYGYTNHEVVIVGWDDNIAWPTGGGLGAWIVKNSWGSFNSMGGYFYLTYDSANVGDDGMYYVGTRNAVTNENLYMEDQPGWLFNVGCGSSEAFGSTVFIPVNNGERLTHVEFYNPFSNMPYNIKIWGTVDSSGSTVTFSNAKATKWGKCQEPGYYTVALPKPILLTKGKEYGVQIKFTDPTGSGYPIPTAAVYPGIIGQFAGMGNSTSYYRCSVSGPFERAVIDGDIHVPCVRARTTY
jgi:C1A family cysteine protease